jgi:hypothetical protein
MTTPAFNHLISINTFSQTERNLPMNDSSLSLDYHLNELQQVATDLRNERTLSAPEAQRSPNRFRMAIGSALLNVGSALVASPSRTRIQAR